MVRWVWVCEHFVESNGGMVVGIYDSRTKAVRGAEGEMETTRFTAKDFKESGRTRMSTEWNAEDHLISIRKVRVK